ncbi:helix-turn-helix transcriptional regulator [Rummeliibacillus suwonensis]|uniref:helix-turn-helix transcriptional regulator n=1 Tax=Rummeliibacillus suwonensis TaxID=1306154 RepID=UPI00289A0821|nr:helix-turn-helix transcriptional regulator [Rummeliibacillus suwonensis]
MKKTNVPNVLKEMRGKDHQQKLADEVHVSRETISKYENGRSKLPKDVSRMLTKKYDSPKLAITVRNEYTGTGPVWLDGPNADLHRSAVKEKTLEELQEAIQGLKNTCLVKPLKNLTAYELQNVHSTLEELVEVQTAIDHLIAVVCMEANISYTGLWSNHYRSLASAGYIGGAR